MITDRAKASFDTLLHTALKSGLSSADGPCVIEPIAEIGAKVKEKKLVILTVSSYLFRLMAMIYFRNDAATRAFFARTGGVASSDADGAVATVETSEQEFFDRVAEAGNMICGSFNRELGKSFPHVGMSTPNIIDKDCMRYVDLLGCELTKHYKLTLEGGLPMYASLCVTAYGNVDFHVDQVVEEEVSTGELEMF